MLFCAILPENCEHKSGVFEEEMQHHFCSPLVIPVAVHKQETLNIFKPANIQ